MPKHNPLEFEKVALHRFWGDVRAGLGAGSRMIVEACVAAAIVSPAALFLDYWAWPLTVLPVFVLLHLAWSAWSSTKAIYYESQGILQSHTTDRLDKVRASLLHFVSTAPIGPVDGTFAQQAVDDWFHGADDYLRTMIVPARRSQFYGLVHSPRRTVQSGIAMLRSLADDLVLIDLI
jgi:hypothetical protein